jgi:hypothetical protein
MIELITGGCVRCAGLFIFEKRHEERLVFGRKCERLTICYLLEQEESRSMIKALTEWGTPATPDRE